MDNKKGIPTGRSYWGTFFGKVVYTIEAIASVVIILVILVMLYNLISEVAFENSLRDMEPEGFTRFLAGILALIVGLEFVKLLTRQRAVDLIEVMQLAVARQMIVEHLSMKEIIIGVTAIAILFAARKYLFLKESEAKELHEDF